ncbi:hypothetical protein RRF57_006270 [Xylaria bambusicola]|uniref:Uncharacterized protein n=1 Tax=Xylaria bambusicola TaxID=326684 RepID=A0AAN7UE07_9PEZI
MPAPQWIKSKGGVSLATCPSCREPITCEKKHAEFGLFGSKGTTKAQARDVVALRKLPKGCSKCFQQVRAEQHMREKALRDQQAAAEAARVTEQVEARLRTVEPTVRAAATLGRENEPRWDAIQTSLLQLQGDIQVRNRVEHPNNQNTRLRQVYRKASETINRRTRQSSQADEAMWEFVDARVSDVRFAAEDRLERERRNADIAERIAAHLSAVRELVAESMGNYNF